MSIITRQRVRIRHRRFMEFRDKYTVSPSGCWLWTEGSPKYYPMFKATCETKYLRASRVAYDLFVGPLVKGQQINHHCDNKQCVNPDHLYQGSHTDNVNDIKATKHLSLIHI